MTKAHKRWCQRDKWRRLIPFKDRYHKFKIGRVEAEKLDRNARFMNEAFAFENYGNGRVITQFKSEKWLRWLIGKNFDVSREVFFEYDPNHESYLFWQTPNDDLLNQLIEEGVLPESYGK